MKNKKKQENELEYLENLFSAKNEHCNTYSLKIYKEAKEKDLFTDFKALLDFFWNYEGIFYSHRTKPLQVSKQFFDVMKSKDWNNDQQAFILKHLVDYFENTEWTEKNKKINADNELKQLVEILKIELSKIQPETEKPFDWHRTKQHLEKLTDTNEKIKYLIIKKAEYDQQKDIEMVIGTSFGKKCEIEIKKLKALAELENEPEHKKTIPQFKLSDKKGSKTDLIRILNAIYELRMIEKPDGQIPSKEKFMKQAGNFFGTDLSKYDSDLSQAFNNTALEANLKIFEDMINITKDKHSTIKKG